MNKLPIDIIRMREGDRGFVLNSWLKSNRSSVWTRGVESPAYFAEHGEVVRLLLNEAFTHVAVWKEDPNEIYGWVCYDWRNDELLLHYVYVKSPFRKLGIATQLLNVIGAFDANIVATHRSYIAEDAFLLKRKFKKLEFNPYIAYRVMHETQKHPGPWQGVS